MQKFFDDLFGWIESPNRIEIRVRDQDGNVECSHLRSISAVEKLCKVKATAGYDVYFGVNPRRYISDKQVEEGIKKGGKDSFYEMRWAWVDLDDEKDPHKITSLFPPTYLIESGNGYHAYFKLSEPVTDMATGDHILRSIAEKIGADKSCAEVSHVLRVPETFNYKNFAKPKDVKIIQHNSDVVYHPNDFTLPITTGLKQSFNMVPPKGSGSENDWRIFNELIDFGYSKFAIRSFALYHKFCRKAQELGNGDGYLERTLAKLQVYMDTLEDFEPRQYLDQKLAVNRFGYARILKNAEQMRISNFRFSISAMHLQSASDIEPAYICSVHTQHKVWADVILPVSVLNSTKQLKEFLFRAEWVWNGSDADTVNLKWVLTEQWVELNSPQVTVTSKLGRQQIDGIDYYVAENDVLGSGDILFTPSKKEYPSITWPQSDLDIYSSGKVLQRLLEINDQNVVLPILGWFVSSVCKPVLLREYRLRFPHLHIYGTRGAGKTLTLALMQQLMGSLDPQTWVSSTTPFVLISLLGSTESIPVCLTEYRSSTNTGLKFDQVLRVAYDNGKDARGKPNQTTVTYPLTAPICLDGEEPPTDPAIRERTIVLYMNVQNVSNPDYSAAFNDVSGMDLSGLGKRLINFVLSKSAEQLYTIYIQCFSQFELLNLPNRIKSNLAYSSLGIELVRLWALENGIETMITDSYPPYFTNVIDELVPALDGRTELPVDDFISAVSHEIVSSVGKATYECSIIHAAYGSGSELAFNFKSAYSWYLEHSKRRGLNPPQITAVKRQLKEVQNSGGYVIGNKSSRCTGGTISHMLFIDLDKAHASGLDVLRRGVELPSNVEVVQNEKTLVN